MARTRNPPHTNSDILPATSIRKRTDKNEPNNSTVESGQPAQVKKAKTGTKRQHEVDEVAPTKKAKTTVGKPKCQNEADKVSIVESQLARRE
jgi:hypothetical protein